MILRSTNLRNIYFIKILWISRLIVVCKIRCSKGKLSTFVLSPSENIALDSILYAFWNWRGNRRCIVRRKRLIVAYFQRLNALRKWLLLFLFKKPVISFFLVVEQHLILSKLIVILLSLLRERLATKWLIIHIPDIFKLSFWIHAK